MFPARVSELHLLQRPAGCSWQPDVEDINPASVCLPARSRATAHLPQAHLLLEEIGKLLFSLRAVVLAVSTLAFVIPADDSSVSRCPLTRSKINSNVLLPLKAVTLLSSLVEIVLEAERPSGLIALGLELGAERRRALQLGSYGFGVTAVVARSGTVWRLVAEEPGDGAVTTAGGRTEGTHNRDRTGYQLGSAGFVSTRQTI